MTRDFASDDTSLADSGTSKTNNTALMLFCGSKQRTFSCDNLERSITTWNNSLHEVENSLRE